MRLSYTQLQSIFEICWYHCILYLSSYQTVTHKSSNFVTICLIGVCLLSFRFQRKPKFGMLIFKTETNCLFLHGTLVARNIPLYFLQFKLQPNSATFWNLLHLFRWILLICLRLDLLNSFKRKAISKIYPSKQNKKHSRFQLQIASTYINFYRNIPKENI